MSTSKQLCHQFTLDEIKSATRDFDDELIIGKGGFGSVYIGSINNSSEIVAIKRLSIESTQGDIEFLREIETLSKLQHDNLVRLEGYCKESNERILVYEFMPNGTLVDHLYKIKDSYRDNQPSRLSWEQRLNICIGAARGLDFLHREAVPGVIHRDIKGSNILLDDKFVAKIADFGLAKLVQDTSDPTITSVSSTIFKGTFGYMDPEYFYTQRLTTKTDVYAFGVVLLVVLSGRPAVDNNALEDQRSLSEWANKCIEKNRVDMIIDPYLVGKISSTSLKQFVKVSQKCLLRQSERRPTMEEVVVALELALKKQSLCGLTRRQPNEPTNFRQMIMMKLQLVPKKRQCEAGFEEKCEQLASVAGCLCPKFSLDEIITATQNFKNMIRCKKFPNIYLGRIYYGEEIVEIVRYKANGRSKFLMDLEMFCKMQHDHIVCLKGYCVESSEMILVYEYPAKGSLDNHLHKRGNNGKTPLTWEQRLNICLGAARGLNFLHRINSPAIIFHSVNCSSIMLDDNFKPKFVDFSWAIQANDRQYPIPTNNLGGEVGYICPEYHQTLRAGKRCDVYDFGIILMVVLSGRKLSRNDIKKYDVNTEIRHGWAIECIQDNRIDKLIDPDLKGQLKSESLEKLLEVIQNCLHMVPGKRHTIEYVVTGLESVLEKQLSSTSTQWVESQELPNLLFLLPKDYSSESLKELMEEYSDM